MAEGIANKRTEEPSALLSFALSVPKFRAYSMKVQCSVTITFLIVSQLLLARPAVSQQAPPAGIPVQMTVTVEPKRGNEIPTITRQDIIVNQGRERRQVTDWVPATGNRAALELAILVDEGSGMSLGSQLSDIRNFIGQQPPTTLIGVGYMQNGTVQMIQNFTPDHTAAAKALRLPMGFMGASSSPYFSLSELIKRWPVNSAGPRREVLMITSGIDFFYGGRFPDPYVDATIHDAQCAGIPVFSIYTPAAGHFGHAYWSVYWGQNYLFQLSEETGGESYYLLGPQAPVAFEPFLNKFSRQLRQQFLLTFLAKPEKKAATQSVRLSTEIHAVDMIAADRVCVPAAPAR